MTTTSEHWDPQQHERQWYRSRETGDRGYLVRRDGKDKIRLDQPGHEVIRSYSTAAWEKEDVSRPATPSQVAQVAFEADKQLCRVLGLQREATREWANLSDHQRIEWMEIGPKANTHRKRLYAAVRAAMDPLVRA